ncbi:MAG: NAD-dependent epimerase/dehydratase family protein [Lentisphaeria bacterium]|nr:NAD-dependent epimerase/dehydratase family protein [Lentisphaeria bacterium]
MRYLVTGGGGFLGGRLARELLSRGEDVRVLGRHDYPDLAAAGAECHVGDIRDSQAVKAASRGCDGIFHVAARAGVWGDRQEYFSINVRGTANVLQACLEEKVTRLVYTSSPSVVFDMARLDIENGDESLPYPKRYAAVYPESKARAEKMVLAANGWDIVVGDDGVSRPRVERLATCALRPHLIWGTGDPHLAPRIVNRAKAGKLKIVGTGKNRISMTHVDNAALGHIQAMAALSADSPVAGQAYFINDPEPVAMWAWINRLLHGAGAKELDKRVPYRLAWLAGAALEAVHGLFPRLGEPPMTRFVAAQLAGSHWFTCAKAVRDFGYAPKKDLEEAMKSLIASFLCLHAGRRVSDRGGGKT